MLSSPFHYLLPLVTLQRSSGPALPSRPSFPRTIFLHLQVLPVLQTHVIYSSSLPSKATCFFQRSSVHDFTRHLSSKNRDQESARVSLSYLPAVSPFNNQAPSILPLKRPCNPSLTLDLTSRCHHSSLYWNYSVVSALASLLLVLPHSICPVGVWIPWHLGSSNLTVHYNHLEGL